MRTLFLFVLHRPRSKLRCKFLHCMSQCWLLQLSNRRSRLLLTLGNRCSGGTRTSVFSISRPSPLAELSTHWEFLRVPLAFAFYGAKISPSEKHCSIQSGTLNVTNHSCGWAASTGSRRTQHWASTGSIAERSRISQSKVVFPRPHHGSQRHP